MKAVAVELNVAKIINKPREIRMVASFAKEVAALIFPEDARPEMRIPGRGAIGACGG
jgi:hypothetical protein